MKNLEDQVKELNEKLSGAQTEIPNKDNIVKQHAKAAEEAVSGLILIYLRYVEGKETCAVTLSFYVKIHQRFLSFCMKCSSCNFVW